MSGSERSLMSTEKPTLEQCGDPMHPRHGNMGGVPGGRQHGSFVEISVADQPVVATPAIGAYHAGGEHCFANEWYQVSARCIGDMTHSHPSKPFGLFYLHGDRHDALIGPTATFPALFGPADQRLVNFHFTRQSFTFGTHHCDSVTLQHRPRHSVAGTQCPFERLGGHPVFRGRNVPSNLEPSGQRRSRLVQDRPCTNRSLVPTSSAHQSTTRLAPRTSSRLACRADKPVRPSQLLQIGRACHIVGEHRHEFTVRTRTIGTWHQSRYCVRSAHF